MVIATGQSTPYSITYFRVLRAPMSCIPITITVRDMAWDGTPGDVTGSAGETIPVRRPDGTGTSLELDYDSPTIPHSSICRNPANADRARSTHH